MKQKQTNELETKLLFCKICESAYLETTEIKNDLHYVCIMCNEFESKNGREILENNFDDNLVIDCCN
jgi:hypothetical protein